MLCFEFQGRENANSHLPLFPGIQGEQTNCIKTIFCFVPFKILFCFLLFLTLPIMPTSSTAISAFKISKLQHGKVTSIIVLHMETTDNETHTHTKETALPLVSQSALSSRCFSKVPPSAWLLQEGPSCGMLSFALLAAHSRSARRSLLLHAFPKEGGPNSPILPCSWSSWHPVLFFFIFPDGKCQVIRAGRSSTEADNVGFARTGEPSVLSGS